MSRYSRVLVSSLIWPLVALLVGESPPVPDQWGPYLDNRQVSPLGTRYVVIRKERWRIKYELCERRPDAEPILPTERPRKGSDDLIRRDPLDQLIIAGHVRQLPLEVRVLDHLGGFVLFENYGSVGWDKALTYITDTGEITVNLTWRDIMGPPPRKTVFGHTPKETKARSTVSSYWWYEGFWIDEARKSVVVVSADDILREISLIDGTITSPTAVDLINWFDHGTLMGRRLALEVGTRLDQSDLRVAAIRANELTRDETQAMSIRLRAAVIAKRAGYITEFDPLFEKAKDAGHERDAINYAIRHLHRVMGVENSLPLLRELMTRAQNRSESTACQQAFVSIGEPAVPLLGEMLLEDRFSRDTYFSIILALREIGSELALPALRRAREGKEEGSSIYGAINRAISACSN